MRLNKFGLIRLIERLETVPLATVVLLCVLAAAILSVRVIQAQNGWITDDSVLYLEVARLFSVGQWKAGIELYNWPLYPALILVVHKVTGIGLQTSAQCLVVLFFSIASYYFYRFIILCGGDRLAVLVGALILLGSPYIVGDVLPMLIRDQGFWAFFLAGLTYFMRFYQLGGTKWSLLWQSAMILAASFRIEGITFLALLPLVLLVDRTVDIRQRIARLFSAYSLTISLTLFTLVSVALQILSMENIGRLKDVINPDIYSLVILNFQHRTDAMAEYVLGSFLDDYAATSLLITFIVVIISKILAASGFGTVVIVLLELRRRFSGISPHVKWILLWASAIALINASFVLLKDFVLSGRYLVSFGLILMGVAAVALERTLLNLKNRTNRDWLTTTVSFGVVLLLIFNIIHNSLPVERGHNYEQEAVAWIKENTTSEDKIFYVSPRARYYAGEEFTGRGYDYWQRVSEAISTGDIFEYDYLAINISHEHPEHEQELRNKLPNYQVVKEFEGIRGKKKIVIFARDTQQ